MATESSRSEQADADRRIWAELEVVMLDGPGHHVSVRGTITASSDDSDEVVVAHRVWVDGHKVRIENSDGAPHLISDGFTSWSFWRGAVPVQTRARADGWAGNGTELARRRTREENDIFGFGEPIGPIHETQFLDRRAWTLRFAPPSGKPNPMDVVVDARTGLVLRRQFGDSGVAQWTEFIVGEPMNPGLFSWDGPHITEDEMHDADRLAHVADLALRAEWFRENVTANPLRVRGPVDVMLNEWTSTGRFQATMMGAVEGSLARRPHARSQWRLGWSETGYRWSDELWDWAVSVWDDELTPHELADLQHQLGSVPTT